MEKARGAWWCRLGLALILILLETGPNCVGTVELEEGADSDTGGGFRPSQSSTCTLFDPTNGRIVGTGFNSRGLPGWKGELEAQDEVRIGLYSGIHRFMLSTKDDGKSFMAGNQGTLGLAYSSESGTASLLRTLSDPAGARPSWGIVQPPNFLVLRPLIFSVVASQDAGELHLGGYDASAALTPVRYSRIHNSSGQSPYTVKVKGMRYGSQEILFFGDGGADSMDATFDTGSDCVMLPDMAFGALEASPFRTLLEAHVKHGHQTLSFVLADAEGGELTLSLPYKAWTHPGGCLGPYKGHNIVLGLPIFRQYLVVHDMSAFHFRIGIAPINPEYEMGRHARNWEYGGDSSLLEEDSGGYIAGRQLLKLRLSTDGGRPARTYMLGIGVGTPAQTLSLAVDTGSYQVNIKRWHAGAEEGQKSEEEEEKKASAAKRKSAAIEKLKKKAKGQGQKVSKSTNTKAEHDEKESRVEGGKGAKGRSSSSSSSNSSSRSSRKRHEEHKKQASLKRLKDRPSKHGGTPPSEDGDDRGNESERGRGQIGNARGLSAAQVACLVVAGVAAGLLLLFEVRRQRMTSVKRFRLVDYSHGLPDGTSRIEFSDCE